MDCGQTMASMNETTTPNEPDPDGKPQAGYQADPAGQSTADAQVTSAAQDPADDESTSSSQDPAGEEASAEQAAAAFAQAPPPRRLVRSEHDRMIGGVAGG